MKLLEEKKKKEKKICNLELGKDILGTIPKVWSIKEELDKLETSNKKLLLVIAQSWGRGH